MRRVDWLLIANSLGLGAMRGSFTLSDTISQQILIFHGVFCLLSFINPVGRPRWKRWTYAALNILLFTTAASVTLGFPLQMYWFLAKSCFLLGRRNAISITVSLGILYLSALHWSRPAALALVEKIGVERWLDPNYIFLQQFSFYLGASCFTLLFSLLVIAEQNSRRKAEALTQQVKTLAATLERTRIAREIHDSLGHSLTTLDVQLELAQRLQERDTDKTKQSLQVAKQLTHQCLTEVRRSVQTMRGDEFDLEDAIATLIHSIQQNPSLRLHLDLHLPPLPTQIGHQLYCIIQEGLTNVQKHAQATTVLLKGKQNSDGITIVLEDDGQGFQVQAEQTGFGLRGMQERAQILGGWFTVHSSPGEGTSLQVVIPYPPA